MSSVTDFESMMSLNQPIKSSAAARWERKGNQNSNGNSNSGSDRFIANRAAMENGENLAENRETPGNISAHAQILLAENKRDCDNSRVLAFKTKAPLPTDGYQNSMKVLYSAQGTKKDIVKVTRHISSAPVKVLDAPEILNDYCETY